MSAMHNDPQSEETTLEMPQTDEAAVKTLEEFADDDGAIPTTAWTHSFPV